MTSVTQKKGRAQVLRERYGDDYFKRLGDKGGAAAFKKLGREHYQRIGQHGGVSTMILYGPEHFAEAGRKGGKAGMGKAKARKSRKGAAA